MGLVQSLRIVIIVFITNCFLVFKIMSTLIIQFFKLSYNKRLIFLRNRLNESTAILNEIFGKEKNSSSFISLQFKIREEYNQAGQLAHLESDNEKANINYSIANEISTKTLEKLGIVNLPFTFIGSEITKSIGHTAQCLSLRQKIIDVETEISHRYLITSSLSANRNYLSYWYKYFPNFDLNSTIDFIIEREMWPLYESVNTIRVKDKEVSLLEAHNIYSKAWEKLSREPLLCLSDQDREFGYNFLKAYSFEKVSNGKFVTIHVRNSRLWANGRLLNHAEGRNADVRTYQKAVNHLLKLGYFVIRIGDKDEHSLIANSNFLDYTKVEFKSDRLNTFFLAECDFLIGTNSGPICVPPTFGKKVLQTNSTNIGKAAYFTNSLMLPKLIKDRTNTLSLDEMRRYNAGFYSDNSIKKVEGHDFKWQNNSEDEIFEAVLEMLKPLVVTNSPKQQEFQAHIKKLGGFQTANISNSFINRWESVLM